jgi:ADP-ribose pyrophosphatase YjhB (NUDIX family)
MMFRKEGRKSAISTLNLSSFFSVSACERAVVSPLSLESVRRNGRKASTERERETPRGRSSAFSLFAKEKEREEKRAKKKKRKKKRSIEEEKKWSPTAFHTRKKLKERLARREESSSLPLSLGPQLNAR